MPEGDRDRRPRWQVGQRVSRKDSEECGTVIENDGSLKVRWDTGATSYFRHRDEANVKLEEIISKK